MLKLALLGAIGYLGYNYFAGNRVRRPAGSASAIAGGPLSANATLQDDPTRPPVSDPFAAPTA